MISVILKQNPRTPVEQITTSSEADAGVLKHALSELHAFAHTNLRELNKMEKRVSGSSSSIDMFCRIDVGIMEKEDGMLDYFVNEVERGPNVCLWAGAKWPHLIGEVGTRFRMLLHSWVRAQY